MTANLIAKSETRNYSDLFRLDLNWGSPDQKPITLELDGETYTATNVSSYQGLRVWEISTLPGSAIEAKLDQLLAKTTTNRLVIFHDDENQAWRWPSRTTRGASVSSRPSRHVHKTGSNDPKFAAKLDAIYLPDDVVLDANQVLAKVRGAFDVETKNETKRASKLMARMYTAIEKAYPADFDRKQRDHEISVSLARILFLLFGDDTEMWATELFQEFIKDHTKRDGSDVGPQLNALFHVLDTPPKSRAGLARELAALPYVNGGIFDERITLPDLDQDFRDVVLDAAAVDWSTISPAIFGSMFQSVRDAQTRRELGEHYTSEENILKTLNPLFLDELRDDYAAALHRDTTKKQVNALNALWKRLGDIRYMDPACGCGNFIIVAYRELRAIELDIMLALQDLSGDSQLSFDPTLDLKVTLDHFYGIEIDEWPARIAETAMFLIDRQCDLRLKERFGEAPQRLPIQREATILVGDALEVPWVDVCRPSTSTVVAGNPPFLGHISRSVTQTEQLRAAWDGADIGRLDYVTAWYAKAIDYFGSVDGRWAFVSTNSITQGDQVPRLFGPVFRASWRIRFAHRTFAWTSEAAHGAAVHCNVIGFDRGGPKARLFDYPTPRSEPAGRVVATINAYLVDGPNVLVTPRRNPLSADISPVTFGNMPRDGGGLVVEEDAYASVMADPVAAMYVRPFLGSEELVRGAKRWCLWLTDLDPDDVKGSPILRTRIAGVRRMRLESEASSTRAMAATPHLFGQRAAEMFESYLAIPAVVSESRPFYTAARLPAEAIASNKLYVAPDEDGFQFGIISSSMFLTWQLTVGNRLKSDPSFSNTLVWNNFPLPPLGRTARQAIVSAGQNLLAERAKLGEIALVQMYPSTGLDSGLQAAHDALDERIDSAFGIKSVEPPSELQRQDVLFERYAELTANLHDSQPKTLGR